MQPLKVTRVGNEVMILDDHGYNLVTITGEDLEKVFNEWDGENGWYFVLHHIIATVNVIIATNYVVKETKYERLKDIYKDIN